MKRQPPKYIITPKEEKIFLSFLKGELSTREAGKALNLSHQQVINASTSLCRQWYTEGRLKIKI